jgi:Do/DeqQ family serine protease
MLSSPASPSRLFACLFAVLISLAADESLAQPAVPQTTSEITLSFAPVVKKAAPAVVNIYTRSKVQVRQNPSPFMNDPFFRQFFGGEFGFGGRAREQVVSSLGSGVIVKPDGLIVTSYHVIKDAQEIKVSLSDHREFEARVEVRDSQTDLAFLRIDASGLPHLAMRDSDSLEVGDLVLAIGNPFGVGQTVTQGIISALARTAVGISDYAYFIQTDAAINPGNSGGALVDMRGNLIGVNTAIYSTSGGSSGIGFAIPSNMISAMMQAKPKEGKVVRPWLGIAVQPVSRDMAESLGLTSPRGVIIRKIWPGSPAASAGLKTGDVILSIGGSPIASEQEMQYRIALTHIGEANEFIILRGGKEQPMVVEMQPPPETPKRDMRTLKGRHPLDGVSVANLSPALALELGVENLDEPGVVVTSTARVRSGLGGSFMPGDVIVQVNDTDITSTSQLEKLLKSAKNSWQILYRRQGKMVSLTVRM